MITLGNHVSSNVFAVILFIPFFNIFSGYFTVLLNLAAEFLLFEFG